MRAARAHRHAAVPPTTCNGPLLRRRDRRPRRHSIAASAGESPRLPGVESSAVRRRPSMPRTTARSSRSSSSGARKTSARGRSARTQRSRTPRLTQRQVREIGAVFLILLGLLGLIAAMSLPGSLLAGVHTWLIDTWGHTWFVPVGLAFAAGAYLLWLGAPRLRPLDLVSGSVAVLSLIGLFGMAGHNGGSVGDGIDQALVSVASPIGAWALLFAGLVVGLIVTLRFSPGAAIQALVRSGQAAYAESRRIERLVSPVAGATAAAKSAPAKPSANG